MRRRFTATVSRLNPIELEGPPTRLVGKDIWSRRDALSRMCPCLEVRSRRFVLPWERELCDVFGRSKTCVPRWSAGKTPPFSLSIGIGNFRSQSHMGRKPLLMTWPWLIGLRVRPGKWEFGSCRSQASINSGYKPDPARRLKVYSTPMRLEAQGCWALINPSTGRIAEPDPSTCPIDTFPNTRH